MAVQVELMRRTVLNILTTRPDEIACEDCLERLDRFVDMMLEGQHPAEAMPLVQDHLNRCPECRDEFQALLEALRYLRMA